MLLKMHFCGQIIFVIQKVLNCSHNSKILYSNNAYDLMIGVVHLHGGWLESSDSQMLDGRIAKVGVFLV
jgi:hypothetical protein